MKKSKPEKLIKISKAKCSQLSKVVVAVDIGRSSVKAAWSINKEINGRIEFPFIVATSKKFLSESTTSFSTEKDTFEMVSKSSNSTPETFLFGETAILHGNNVKSDFSETQVFHDYAVSAILFCVGKILVQNSFLPKNFTPKVILSINLTYDNIQSSAFYSSKIKKSHSFEIVDFGKRIPVKFSIQELYCFQQGYASIFKFLGTENEKEIFKDIGLSIDIGRYTVDISIIRNGSLLNGASLAIGTHQLIEIIKRDAKSKGLSLSSSNIEETFVDQKKTFSSLVSKSYSPFKVFEKSSPKYFKMVSEEILSFVGDTSLSWIIVVGGFAGFLQEALKKTFPNLPYFTVKEPRFSNCLGMVKFLEMF